MSCPTCSHTLAMIADETLKVWHCDRCGTVVTKHHLSFDNPGIYVPKLVERCRHLIAELERHDVKIPLELAMSNAFKNVWESIHLPQDRRPQ